MSARAPPASSKSQAVGGRVKGEVEKGQVRDAFDIDSGVRTGERNVQQPSGMSRNIRIVSRMMSSLRELRS